MGVIDRSSNGSGLPARAVRICQRGLNFVLKTERVEK